MKAEGLEDVMRAPGRGSNLPMQTSMVTNREIADRYRFVTALDQLRVQIAGQQAGGDRQIGDDPSSPAAARSQARVGERGEGIRSLRLAPSAAPPKALDRALVGPDGPSKPLNQVLGPSIVAEKALWRSPQARSLSARRNDPWRKDAEPRGVTDWAVDGRRPAAIRCGTPVRGGRRALQLPLRPG